MNYTLNIGVWNSVFAVPSSIVDDYIKLASEKNLKLILFMLRHSGETYSADKLRTELGFSELGEVEDAAFFWVQRGVIRHSNEEDGWFVAANNNLSSDNVSDDKSRFEKINSEKSVTDVELDMKISSKSAKKVTPESVSTSEITRRINEDPEIQVLLAEAEKIYGRPLLTRDTNVLIGLIDHYGFPISVVLMLLQYCSKCKKLTPANINNIAGKWQENGITTIELADSKLRTLESQDKLEHQLMNIIEISEKFDDNKEKLIQKNTLKKTLNLWLDDWGLNENLILLAINKTIESINKPILSYASKILENWTKEGITTVEQVENLENTSNTPSNSSFDMDDVMARIKNRYKG